MRLLVSSLAAAALFAGSIARPAHADPCARPAEKEAFDVAGLKSELMVVAIACQAQDRYNSFVSRYQHDLQADERMLNNYFARTAGHHAQQEHDSYITNLANAESDAGIQQGTLFCQQHLAMFDEVMALHTGKDLPAYAESKSFPQPIVVSECTAPKKKLHTAEDK